MTDITELAQSLKAAAIDAKELAIIARYSKGRAAAEKFYAMANPNNVIALVEALEKAQGMEAYWKTQCRGITDHCEELQACIAELESRTVTVKLPRPGFVTISGERTAVYLKADVDAAMLAAGIEESR
ncbi:Ead domain protein [Klebsiella variicola]|uniref:hypothetical protein n=1 Tax=Klebsiella variicola TaxID=244366 RepID=UPI000E2B03C2|nr:hypothetical protein [Klebsiella variicola]SXE69520.1 Ead domain protein [Klebsiella variicola]